MSQITQVPVVFTGDELKDILDFVVEGPELSRGSFALRFESSAEVAMNGFLRHIYDAHGVWVSNECLAISATYPVDVRLLRTGIWYNNGAPWDWDEFIEESDRLFPYRDNAGEAYATLALLVNADDHPRNLHGMVWGPRQTIEQIAYEQRGRANLAMSGYPPFTPKIDTPKPAFDWRQTGGWA